MSEKIKQILKRIAGWLVYIAVVSLLIIGPNLYWLNSSAPWSGRQAVCGGESKDGIRSDLQRIVLDAADLNSGPVELSAELSYAPSQGIFYLRDGIFSVPLDTSDCQGLEGFQNGESFVAVKGTVEKDDEILILAVNGLRETVPIWVQIMYNAGIWGGIAGTIMLLAMGFAGVRALFRKLLVRIGRGKPKPDPLPEEALNKNAGRMLSAGIIAPFLWAANPIVGAGVHIFSLIHYRGALRSQKRKMAIAGVILCVAGLVLMPIDSIGMGRFKKPYANFYADGPGSLAKTITPTGKESLELTSYVSTKGGFAMHQPKGWTPDENGTEDSQFVFNGPEDGLVEGKPFRPQLNVDSAPAPSLDIKSTQDAVRMLTKSLEEEHPGASLAEERIMLAGGRLDASFLDSAYKDNGADVHILLMVVIKDGIMYFAGSKMPPEKWTRNAETVKDSLRTFHIRQKTYVNEKEKFSMSVPKHWIVVESGKPETPVAFRNALPDTAGGEPFFANINVAVGPAQKNSVQDIYDTVEEVKNALPKVFKNYSIVEDEDHTTAGGQNMHFLGAVFTQQGVVFRNLQLFAVGGNKLYVVTATAPSEVWALYGQVIKDVFETFDIVGPSNLGPFADCIKSKSVVFYGAFDCSHCQAQKKLFGDAASRLPYVECSTPDGKYQTGVCSDRDIKAYPTWEFPDGSRQTGELPLETLSERTGCALP